VFFLSLSFFLQLLYIFDEEVYNAVYMKQGKRSSITSTHTHTRSFLESLNAFLLKRRKLRSQRKLWEIHTRRKWGCYFMHNINHTHKTRLSSYVFLSGCLSSHKILERTRKNSAAFPSTEKVQRKSGRSSVCIGPQETWSPPNVMGCVMGIMHYRVCLCVGSETCNENFFHALFSISIPHILYVLLLFVLLKQQTFCTAVSC